MKPTSVLGTLAVQERASAESLVCGAADHYYGGSYYLCVYVCVCVLRCSVDLITGNLTAPSVRYLLVSS